MFHSYKGLRDEVLRYLDETAAESPTTLALVKDFLNQAHQQRCCEFPWSFMLWPRVETLTTIGGQHEYTLHQEFHRPLYFRNRATTEFLKELPQRAVVPSDLDWNAATTQSARHFTFWGTQAVQQQLTTNSTVRVVSSSNLDIGATYQVAVKGETADGALAVELLTPDGGNAVTGTTVFRTILAVTKASGWNGTLTLTATTGGTTILKLLGQELGRSYKTIYLLEPPTGGEVIEYRFYRQPLALVNDYDIPEIPPPHTQLLVWDALVMMGGYLAQASNLELFREKQMEAQLALYQAYGNEGQTLGAEPTYVQYQNPQEV